MTNPYKIIWRRRDQTGEVTYHARSASEAEYLFHQNYGMFFTVESCELDVKESEFEIAAWVAYRHRNDPDARAVVAKIIKQCRIDRRTVRHRVAKTGLPI
jgi:hypothetical protein